MSQVTIKRGDTLALTINFTGDDNAPVDLTGASITSQVRDAQDNLVATLAPVTTPAAGAVAIKVADTSQWPLGVLRCDVKVQAGGQTLHSETVPIMVQKSVTV